MNRAENTRQLISRRIQVAETLGIRRRRRPVPLQKRPRAVALAYFQSLKEIVDYTRGLVVARILPRLAGWAAEFRHDAASDDLDAEIARLAKTITAKFPPARLKSLAEMYGKRASDQQREEWRKQVRAAVGVDVLTKEPDLVPRIKTFAAENASLITTLPTRALSEVEALVLRGVQIGQRHEDLAEHIEERFSIAEDRAALIARDQIQKLVASIDRERQEAAGVTRFIWRSSRDERVRASHADLDGEVFEWRDPPEVDGEPAIPGSPINCRCTAEPVLDDLIADL